MSACWDDDDDDDDGRIPHTSEHMYRVTTTSRRVWQEDYRSKTEMTRSKLNILHIASAVHETSSFRPSILRRMQLAWEASLLKPATDYMAFHTRHTCFFIDDDNVIGGAGRQDPAELWMRPGQLVKSAGMILCTQDGHKSMLCYMLCVYRTVIALLYVRACMLDASYAVVPFVPPGAGRTVLQRWAMLCPHLA